MGDRIEGPVSRRQRAAVIALVAATLTLLVGGVIAIIRFPSGLGVPACAAIALAAAWFALDRCGTARAAIALLCLADATALLLRNDGWPYLTGLAVGVAVWHAAARTASGTPAAARGRATPAPRPRIDAGRLGVAVIPARHPGASLDLQPDRVVDGLRALVSNAAGIGGAPPL
jgi:hypothetical protein